MDANHFQKLLEKITCCISGELVDASLLTKLNTEFSPSGQIFCQVKEACIKGIEEGWLCNHHQDGISFGRFIRDLNGFSVDVVLMDDLEGPHHRHPNGEIDMIMSLSENATFDGKAEGWVVYEPNSSHKPTVANGKAIVLYLLPGGKIEFTST